MKTWNAGRPSHVVEPRSDNAVIAVESEFDQFAVSSKGAQGLMQVMTKLHDDKYEAFGGSHAEGGRYVVGASNLELPAGYDVVVGGTVEEFVAMMNRQAQAWGLKNTAFKNVTGLTEPGHRSTARDIGVIAAHIISDFPEYFPYYSIKEYKYNNISQPNRNLLLRRDPTVDGMKTGYTEAAGYCLLATAQREFPNLGPAGTPGGAG